ncbi:MULTISPECIES: diaminopimelate dehydrogenase [Aerococcus]|uniref:diaminopimelate dehydrogenase n=1 Tax=Aerococcus TaxID=1375 RepID=UPI000DCE1139|nr:diaminopimelate dehydrogenase [Aerococcus urinae]MDL5184433.1 diaminopimelate dehydrogenase [Aerococcus mictus]MBU5609947.1 diaminopimelate dehydrogenase [Aerococcus urinae]MDK6292366.1 diaminopimelate dehydrogenase [Aerococcus urinae]MDK6375923.1 diaminopimelate dehydrogenase [Aerococcus urinae]MDK6421448.1 diaminopimelate dehydrogenase [Aerococcus urinae]
MIKVGIVGYGNLGKGVEIAVNAAEDMELLGIFTRRQPEQLDTKSPAYQIEDILDFKDKIDVLILCGGSQSDIPVQAPRLAENFNTVDAYDNHDKIPEYFDQIDQLAKENSHVSVIATGWDPGLFSLNRLLAETILPQGQTYTFWGRGVSQGHSDAVRRVDGVKAAIQYTVPNQAMLEAAKAGDPIDYQQATAHSREVYAVLEEGADPDQVAEAIKTMPDYFAPYDQVDVHFISQEELDQNHQGIPHGGEVVRQGQTSPDHHAVYNFALQLGSNPEFTGAVNTCYARAAYRLAKEEQFGAKTVFDIAPAYLSAKTGAQLRHELL